MCYIQTLSDAVLNMEIINFLKVPKFKCFDEYLLLQRDDDFMEPQPVVHKQAGHKQSKTQSNPTKEAKIEKSQPQKLVEQPPKPVVVEKPVTESKQIEKPVITSKQVEKPVTTSKQVEKPSAKPQEKPQVQQKPVEEVVAKISSKQVQNAAPPTASDNSPSTKSSRKKRNELTTLQQMSEFQHICLTIIADKIHNCGNPVRF